MFKTLLLIAQLLGTGGIGNGPSLPSTCSVADVFIVNGTAILNICTSSNTWTPQTPIPSGLITLKTSGTCGTGWTEVTTLNGKMLRGTLAANGNVGQTGGNDTITPTINSLIASAQTFTGTPFSSVINHTHKLSFARGLTTGTASTTQGFTTSTDTSSTAIADVTDNPVGGVASITPAGTNGTSAVTGTLNSFDNRPAYINVIFCSKN